MTIEQALDYIHSVHWRGSIPGLSRTRELLARMGDPQNKLKFVHVAGTNGKGSTCAMLSAMLMQSGYRTGLYTSPYIYRFHERMQVDGVPIPDELLCDITAFVRPHAEAMADTPTEFELVTAIALEFFARMGCDIVILECGMGGELDSTNVIDCPECAIVCTIGLDHTEYLGDTTAKIARTKAGIFKPGGTCLTYPAEESVEAVYRELARERGLAWTRADFCRLHPGACSLEGQEFTFDGFGPLRLSLLGKNQLCNAAIALNAVELLRRKGWHIPLEAVRRALSSVRWPGRFELVRHSPDILLDGGHNPQCMAALRENIRTYLPGRDLVALVGVLADKEYEQMFAPIIPLIRHFVTLTPPNPRALPAEHLARTLRTLGAQASAAENIEAGVAMALAQCRQDSALLCFGSLYLLGDVTRALESCHFAQE